MFLAVWVGSGFFILEVGQGVYELKTEMDFGSSSPASCMYMKLAPNRRLERRRNEEVSSKIYSRFWNDQIIFFR